MHIFIDESGSFAFPSNGSGGFGCVGALVIPENSYQEVVESYQIFSKGWGTYGKEIKGSSLNEDRIRRVIKLLLKYQARYFVVATSMSIQPREIIDTHKNEQARRLTSSLTPKHHPNLVRQLTELQERMQKMSSQEYVQFMLLVSLVENVLRTTLSHFAFYEPKELSNYFWTVDEKNGGKSSLEVCWSLISGGLIQSAFLEKPSMVLPGGDYSFHDLSFLTQEQEWPDHLAGWASSKPGKIIDLKAVLKRSFSFSSSKESIGLQLADIVTNSFRRAVIGNLRYTGWDRLGKLFLKFDDKSIHLLHFDKPSAIPDRVPEEYWKPLEIIESNAVRILEKKWRECCPPHNRHLV